MLRHITSVSFWTLISRIFGYLRDFAAAYYIGASVVLDAFLVAFRLPNMLRTIFGEGALSSVFIPIFSKKIETHGKATAIKFASNILTWLLIIVIPLSILAIIFMPYIANVIAPGFIDEKEALHLVVSYSRITFPYIIFMSIFALYGGILNANKQFWVFASAPVFLNLVQICAIVIAPGGVADGYFLSYGALFAGAIEALWVMVFAYKYRIKLQIKKPALDRDTKILLKRIGPALIGSGITQINVFISTIIASLVPFGVSYLSYADRIYQLPLALIGTAIGIVLLPTLSRAFAKKELDKAFTIQTDALFFAAFIVLPITSFTFLYSSELIRLLFGYGAFNETAIKGTSDALKIFALALPAYIFNKIFITTFFARGDTKTPVQIALFSLIINITLSIYYIDAFAHVAVAIGAVCGAYSSLIAFIVILKKTQSLKVTKTAAFLAIAIIITNILLFAALPKHTTNFTLSIAKLSFAAIYCALVTMLQIYCYKMLKKRGFSVY